jgi:hypothetical protein
MSELWKPIKGYEDYHVSNTGKIKNSRNMLLKPLENTDGYCRVFLFKNGISEQKRVHRLIAEAFIANPNNHPNVIHISRDKTDNDVSNLKWGFRSDSMKQRRKKLNSILFNKP